MGGCSVIIGAAATVYVATNVDNFLVLLAFFAHEGYTDAETVLGQFLGIGLLIAISLLGARAALLLPTPVVGLLGLVPLGLGLGRLFAGGEGPQAASPRDRLPRAGRVFAVAAAAIANGGDNVATYVPFFSLLAAGELAASLLVFAILTGLWCLVARAVVARAAGGRIVGLRGTRLVGVVMIGLGVAILVRSGTPGLLLGR
jgi:cadmium resistance protein CadD (predicted permease)